MTDTMPEETANPSEQGAGDTEQEAPEGTSNAEAAKYRRRLRETEAERDSLTTALDAYRRRDVEQAAEAAGLARGGDLFDAGTQLVDLLAEDGTVDTDKVQEAAEALLVQRPHWATRPPSVDLDLGVRGAPVTRDGKSWADVLKG